MALYGRKTSFHLDITGQMFLIILSLGIFGLQSTLAVQTSEGSPFLLSLGFSKPLISLVWTAGPVAGALAQPYFGVSSDRSRHSWGKRRPFIVAGVACMTPSLLTLAWVQEICSGIAWLFGVNSESKWIDILIKLLAVCSIWSYFLGFQLAQAGFRSLIVDCCPPQLVEQAMLWATRMNCLGNVFCYAAGFIDLPAIFPQLSCSQFQILTLSATIMLILATGVACSLVQEIRPQGHTYDDAEDHKTSFFSVLREAVASVSKVSKPIRNIFKVQFCAWAGWFLFNYYITTYDGALYKREETGARDGAPRRDLLDEASTRYGSFALFLFAVTSLITSIIGPLMIADVRHNGTYRRRLTLRNLWLGSHIVFAACMLSTFLPLPYLHTAAGTTVLVSIVGVSWAITTWAPFSLLSEEINILNAAKNAPNDSEKASNADVTTGVGTIMSLHIAAINIPQLLATLVSSLVFWLVDGNTLAVTGLEWVLRLGGVAAAIAAWKTLAVIDRARMKERDSISQLA